MEKKKKNYNQLQYPMSKKKKFQLGAKSGGNLSSLFEVALDHLKISVGFKSEFNVYSGNWKFGIHLSSKTKDQKITFQTF